MKKFNRLLALLMVGVLAISVLTGCGAASVKNELGEKWVEAELAYLNQFRAEGKKLTNDLELKADLERMLSKIDPETGTIAKEDRYKTKSYENANEVLYSSWTVAALLRTENAGRVEAEELTVELLAERLQELPNKDAMDEEEIADETEYFGEYTAVAYAYKVINGKLYYATAYQRNYKK